ncbi:MAG: dTMP kinase [Coriobacteriales bacterium]|jgi:dTMP kinase|nr:dTMP kinase [Coriobacteriales bacterium]
MSATTTSEGKRGVLITFEGGEGVGKSTQLLLLKARLEQAGYEVLCLREPGGTAIGERIRTVLLDRESAGLDAIAELLLYEAARAQLVTELIEPALAEGMAVLCDRFTDSTLAYQGQARALGFDLVRRANRLGSKGLIPDRTIVLTHDPKTALDRAVKDGADRLEAEGLAFHEQVCEGFELIAAEEPKRVRLVASRVEKQATADAVFKELADLFPRAARHDFPIDEDLLVRIRQERG